VTIIILIFKLTRDWRHKFCTRIYIYNTLITHFGNTPILHGFNIDSDTVVASYLGAKRGASGVKGLTREGRAGRRVGPEGGFVTSLVGNICPAQIVRSLVHSLGPTQPLIQWVPKGVNAAGAWRWPLTPHLVARLSMSRSYTSSPPLCLHGI
jgi:hypothetical protein